MGNLFSDDNEQIFGMEQHESDAVENFIQKLIRDRERDRVLFIKLDSEYLSSVDKESKEMQTQRVNLLYQMINRTETRIEKIKDLIYIENGKAGYVIDDVFEILNDESMNKKLRRLIARYDESNFIKILNKIQKQILQAEKKLNKLKDRDLNPNERFNIQLNIENERNRYILAEKEVRKLFPIFAQKIRCNRLRFQEEDYLEEYEELYREDGLDKSLLTREPVIPDEDDDLDISLLTHEPIIEDEEN